MSSKVLPGAGLLNAVWELVCCLNCVVHSVNPILNVLRPSGSAPLLPTLSNYLCYERLYKIILVVVCECRLPAPHFAPQFYRIYGARLNRGFHLRLLSGF